MGDEQRLLYDPRRERDACGIGLVADECGRASRELLDRALAGLAAMGHRGAWAADGVTSDRLGLHGHRFFSTPTSIMAAFGPEARQRTHLLRVEPGDVSLGKLAVVVAIAAWSVSAILPQFFELGNATPMRVLTDIRESTASLALKIAP